MKNHELDRIEAMLRQVLRNQASLAGNQIRVAECVVYSIAGTALESVRTNAKCIIEQTNEVLDL